MLFTFVLSGFTSILSHEEFWFKKIFIEKSEHFLAYYIVKQSLNREFDPILKDIYEIYTGCTYIKITLI